MTTYILAGGCDRKYPEYAQSIARVVGMKYSQPKILSCLFAREDDEAHVVFPEMREYFLRFFPEGSEFVRAEQGKLLSQIRESDVVYLHGGHTSRLIAALQEVPDIKQEFAGKIVIGSSAGANYLASYGYTPEERDMDVSGSLLDVAVVVHYGSLGFSGDTFDQSFWDKAEARVREVSGKGEILLLPEGMFTIIER